MLVARAVFAVSVLAVLAIVAIWCIASPASRGDNSLSLYQDGEILVKFKPSVSASQVVEILAQRGLDIADEIPDAGLKKVKVPKGRELELVQWLSDTQPVEYAELNYLAYAAGQPNDTWWRYQWNMTLINAPAGWDVITGSHTITIAIVDTGIDLNHPDLAAKIVPGRNVLNPDEAPWDYHGHGTHVAGIAAAVTNNAMGVAGVDWQARLMPVKVMDGIVGDYYDIINGIYHAVNSGAHIINLSLTGWADSSALREAVRYASADRGRLVVAAAGNCAAGGFSYCPSVNPVAYPAIYEDVIAVGAVTSDDRWADYSGYHPYVDIVAPGGSQGNAVWSTYYNDTYNAAYGTSMAAPHVAGLAGLIWAINPSLTRQQVWEIIRDTAAKVDSYPYVNGRNDRCGYGRIDVAAALLRAAPRLSVEPATLTFLAGGNRPAQAGSVTLRNQSLYTPLTWNAAIVHGADRFTIVSPIISGTLAPGTSAPVPIMPNVAGLSQEGTYTGTLRIISNTKAVQGSPQNVPLSLTYATRLELAFNPTVISVAGGPGDYEWLDAIPEGIALTLPDDGASLVSLPFSFPFYGQRYSQVWVSSNGFVSFGQGYPTAYLNVCVPHPAAPNNAIYAFWDDLDPSFTGGVYVKAIGNDTFVIEWANVPHAGPGGSGIKETFEIVLKADGTIKLQYQSVGDASSCTVGVENAAGDSAKQIWCNGMGQRLANRKAFLLTTP